MPRFSAPAQWTGVGALAALWWLSRTPASALLEAAMLVLYLGIAAMILWVGNREPTFAERHPGHAWFSLGFAAFITAVVLLRGDPQEWHVGLLVVGLLMLWRGARLDRRASAGAGIRRS